MLTERLKELERNGKPIRVGVIDAGTFGSQIISQVCQAGGMRMSVVADIQPDKAMRALEHGGVAAGAVVAADTVARIDAALARDRPAVTERAEDLIASRVDVVVEATGNPDLGAQHGFGAVMQKKHVVMVTVEADVLVGYLLKTLADEAGVVYSAAYGDEPALANELCDWATALGFRVIASGKGSRFAPHFRKASPDDVALLYGFKGEDYNARMFCSFLDNTKSAIEMAALSNMTGLLPDVRGMHFPPLSLQEYPQRLCLKSEGGILETEGVVEAPTCIHPDGSSVGRHIRGGMYAVIAGGTPFAIESLQSYGEILGMVIGAQSRKALVYRPQHFVGHEVPIGIARMMLYGEACGAPGGHFSEVVAGAKRALGPGTVLDGEGGYTVYGLVERADIARRERLVPMGLTLGAEVLHEIPEDHIITYGDVKLRESPTLRLRQRQDALVSSV